MKPKAMFYNSLLELISLTIFGSKIIKQIKVEMKGGFFLCFLIYFYIY